MKSILTTILLIFEIAVGVQAVDSCINYFAEESVKLHKRGLFSLRKWNTQLHGYDIEKSEKLDLEKLDQL